MTVKSFISLSEDQHAFAVRLVEAGRFPSVSAVMQHGVEMLRGRMESDELEVRALAEVLTRRRAEKAVPAGKMDARLDRLFGRKRRKHALRG
jgi:antitoxin ParD1/3/4